MARRRQDVAALLVAVRTRPDDPTLRGVLQDRVRDDDGDTPAVEAVATLTCEGCGCPDSGEPMHRDLRGKWHTDTAVHQMNFDTGSELFGWEYTPLFPYRRNARLSFYRFGRWHLVCLSCRGRLVAAKKKADALAALPDPADAAGSLLAGLD